MKMGIEGLLHFLRQPEYHAAPDRGWMHRVRTLGELLVLALVTGMVLALVMGVFNTLTPWDLEQHAFEELLDTFSIFQIILMATLIAPILEEAIFRGPLWFFRKSRNFKWYFWVFSVLFALVHLSNYPGIQSFWYLAPLLVSPQLILGIILGYIRVKFGLPYAMAFHAAYNAILLGPILLLMHKGLLPS